MIWHYITLSLISVLGGALGGLTVHIVWSLIQDWKLRKWIDKESQRRYFQNIKWKPLTDEEIMSLIDKLHRDNKID
jgi:hypothetical protein